jgi:hypothetical protein
MQKTTYDNMKKLLTISRKGIIRQILKEDDSQYSNQQQNSQPNISPDELKVEQENFAKEVKTNLVKFGEFKVGNETVTWTGIFPQEKIEWVYSLDPDVSVSISCDLTQLNDKTLQLIQLLYGYYPKWVEKWSSEIGVKTPEGEQQPAEQPTNEPAPEAGNVEGIPPITK